MKENRKILLTVIPIALVFLALLIVATFCDLDISKSIADLSKGQYQSNNVFGRIFETIGEMPVYIITLFAASIIIADFSKRERKNVFIVFVIILELISVFVAYYAFHELFDYIGIHFEIESTGSLSAELAYLVLGVLAVVGVNFLSKKYSLEFLNSALPWAFIVIATVALSQFITQVAIKIPSGRYRYCTMNTLGDFSNFTQWFKFNGKIVPNDAMKEMGIAKDGMKSFPSGHTCAAATLIVLTSLPAFWSKTNNKKYKIISWSAIVVFVLLVMYTRILMGKHFLSDVLIGMLVTVVCYYVCLIWGRKIYDKKVKLKPLEKTKPIITEERI